MSKIFWLLLISYFVTEASGKVEEGEGFLFPEPKTERNKRCNNLIKLSIDHFRSMLINFSVFSVFQVVSFPNDICSGSSRNGTCYTSEECTARVYYII